MTSRIAAALVLAAAPCTPAPSPTSTGYADVDLQFTDDLRGDLTASRVLFTTDLHDEWYQWELTTADGQINVAFYLDGWMDEFYELEREQVTLTLRSTDHHVWESVSGSIQFSGCLEPGATVSAWVDDAVLDTLTTDRDEVANGEWSGRIPDTAAARQFADLYCR